MERCKTKFRYCPYEYKSNISVDNYCIKELNPDDDNEIENELSLTPKERFILDCIKSSEIDTTNKRRRRGLKRGRPNTEHKKPNTKAHHWIKPSETIDRLKWFETYWKEWFPNPSYIFKPWPWNAIRGCTHAASLPENTHFYLYIICGRKDTKYINTVGIEWKKINEPFKRTKKGILLVLAKLSGYQTECVDHMLTLCKRDKTLSTKIILAVQFAIKYHVKIHLDEMLCKEGNMYYIKEVVAILLNIINQNKRQEFENITITNLNNAQVIEM